MRQRGGGSLFQRGDGRWVFQKDVDGKRTYGYGKTPEEAKARLGKGRRRKPTDVHAILRARDRSGDRALARRRRYFAEEAVRQILRASGEGWTLSDTATIIVAQLSPTRIKHEVTGPCDYCGTWWANTVDHVIPTIRGGTDDPSNVVSACYTCNSRKADRTPEEWAASA